MMIPPKDIPAVAAVFAALAIGTNELIGGQSEASNTYLNAAYSMYAGLLASPYLASVQALALLALAVQFL